MKKSRFYFLSFLRFCCKTNNILYFNTEVKSPKYKMLFFCITVIVDNYSIFIPSYLTRNALQPGVPFTEELPKRTVVTLTNPFHDKLSSLEDLEEDAKL